MALRSIEHVPAECVARRIPGIAAGILLFFTCHARSVGTVWAAPDAVLARELFDESNWLAAQREAQRSMESSPEHEAAFAIKLAAILRQAPADDFASRRLIELASSANSEEIQAFALSEVGFMLWARRDKVESLRTLTRAFQASQEPTVRARASFGACILLSLVKAPPDLNAYWETQLAQCIPSWTSEIRRAGAIRMSPARWHSIWSMPAQWIVKVYRGQVSPAIGSRCSMEPSCSEYFLQASRRNGWLGFAMIGDRMIREPSVYKAASNPVRVNGVWRFADPIDDHAGSKRKGSVGL